MKNLLPLFIPLVIALLLMAGCESSGSVKNAPMGTETTEPAAMSLLGKPLFPLEESGRTVSRKDSLLAIAQANFQKEDRSMDDYIWYGRRLAYLYRYNEAIDVFTKGLEAFPASPELYRHRGHRYISIRQFDRAIGDFEKAAALAEGRPPEIEPDGAPNKLNIPLSTLQFNIYYHWALAHYLKGEFDGAATLYETCMLYSTNPDLLVATTDWSYMTLRRLGQKEKAADLLVPIHEDMDLIENTSYHRRLLMYKGIVKPEDLLDLNNTSEDAQLDIVTQGYGVANWYLYNGDEATATDIFKKILDCDYWPAFGYIAAEADYARM